MQEGETFGTKLAVRSESQIRLDVREDRGGVVGAFVNSGEQDVGVELAAAGDGLKGTAFGLGKMAKRKLDETQTIFSDGGSGIGVEAPLDREFGV